MGHTWYQNKEIHLKWVVEFVDQFIVTCLFNEENLYTDEFLISLPCMSQFHCNSVSLFQSFVSIWHFSYVWLWDIETNSDCCRLFDCGVSQDYVVSARFSSRGDTRSAAPTTVPEDLRLSVLRCCAGSHPGAYLGSELSAWKNMMFSVGTSAWQAGWDCWTPFIFKIWMLKLLLGVSCFWFQWSTKYVINCRVGEQ